MARVDAVRRLVRAGASRARGFLGHEIGRGTAVNLSFAVVNSVLALVTTIFLGNALGPSGVGILSLGFLVLEFAGMIDNLGTGGFMRDYAAGVSQVKFATIFRLKIALGVATSVVFVALSPLMAGALDIPVGVLLLFAVIPSTAIVSSLAQMVHEARRHAWRRNAPGTVEGIAKAILYGGFWLLLASGGDVVLYAWATVAASAIGGATGLLLLPSLRVSPWELSRAVGYVKFGLGTQASGALSKVIFWSDILIIDLVLGHTQQGLFRIAYSVMAFVPLFAGTVGLFLFPAISEAAHARDLPRVRHLFRTAFTYVLAIAVPLALLVIVAARVVLASFGPEFVEAEGTLQLLALISILPALLVPFEALFPGLGRPWTAVWITGVMAIVNVGLDLLLIPVLGVAGALIATSTAFGAGLGIAIYYARRWGVVGPASRAKEALA